MIRKSLALAAGAADAQPQEANKKIVVDFYDKALNQKDFENGEVVEHWDPVQPIAGKAANTNGMF